MIFFKGNTKNIPYSTKIPILFIILWITYVPIIMSKALTSTFGIPPLRYLYGIFAMLPLMFALKNSLLQKKKAFPHITIFILTLFLFCLIELVHAQSNNDPRFGLLNRWLYIYMFFFIIFNLSKNLKNISFIVDFFLIAIIINTLIIDLAAFGIIQFPFTYVPGVDRLLGENNLNAFADMNAMAIMILVIILFIPRFFNPSRKLNIVFAIIFLCSLPLLTQTRGSMIIIAFTLSFFMLNRYSTKNIFQKYLISFLIFIIFLLVSEILLQNINIFLKANRFLLITLDDAGRGGQILASWNNFLDYPWFGVGYKNAAAGMFHHITRSNFQYTQILASSGIFFFILYIYFILKIFTVEFSLLKHPFIILIISLILIQMIFRRPDLPFAFLMFLSYSYHRFVVSNNMLHEHKLNKINIIQAQKKKWSIGEIRSANG